MFSVVHQGALSLLAQPVGCLAIPHTTEGQLFVSCQLDHGLAPVVISAPGVDRVHEGVSLDAPRVRTEQLEALYLRCELPSLGPELLRSSLRALRQEVPDTLPIGDHLGQFEKCLLRTPREVDTVTILI